MTTDEKDILFAETDRLKEVIAELVEETRFPFGGEVTLVNALVQSTGYLHYFNLTNEDGTFTVFYLDNVADQIGEALSGAKNLKIKVTPKPRAFGTVTFWINGTNDIISVDGRRLSDD